MKDNSNKSKTRALQRSIIILLLLIVIVLLLLLLNKNGWVQEMQNGNTPTSGVNGEQATDDEGPMDGSGYMNDAEEFDAEKIKEKLNELQTSCTMEANSYIQLNSLDSECELRLKNANNFYVQVSLLPYDSGTVDISSAYFTSIVIEPGAQMNKIKLDKNLNNLKLGVQPCLLFYDCYSKDDNGKYQKLGSCGLRVSLDVKSLGGSDE